MRICLVSREYPPFFGGGIGAYTLRWSRVLAAAGHRVVVVTVSDDGTVRRESEGAVTVVRLPLIAGTDWSGPHPAIATAETRAAFATFSPVSVFSMQIARALPELAHEFGLEVVEFPETGALGWFTLNDRRTGRIWADRGPAIVTAVHSPTEWIAQWNRTPLRGRRDLELAAMEEDCVRWSDGLVCPSEAVAKWARERWRCERPISVIPLPLGELEAIARRSANGGETAERRVRSVLFTGRLEPRKGVDTLFAGFQAAVRDGTDLRLDLAGEDMPIDGAPFGASCIARLGPEVRERIRSHGRVPPERVAALQNAADAIIVPAPMDNFPLACVEAMAHGRMVIAADAGGQREMIRDGVDGLLFAPGETASCAAALQHAAAMSGSQASSLGRAGAARIQQLCGNETVTERRVAHYKEAISARATASRTAGRRWITVNAGAADEASIEELRRGAAAAGADFAHGWTRDEHGGIRPFSTPRTELLAVAPRQIGPVVIDAAIASQPEVARLLHQKGQSEAAADSVQAVVLALLSRGCTGAVVPGVLTAEAAPRPAPVQDGRAALEAELKAIHTSRGWRAVQRVYDVLHILRGRGLRRPQAAGYHRPGGPAGSQAEDPDRRA